MSFSLRSELRLVQKLIGILKKLYKNLDDCKKKLL